MNESFGTYLKKERELRKIPLAEVVDRTNIKQEYLVAMEADHFERLPGMTFAKGYLQAYTKYIGLDTQEVLLRFEDYLKQLAGPEKSSKVSKQSKWFWWVAFLILGTVSAMVVLWMHYDLSS